MPLKSNNRNQNKFQSNFFGKNIDHLYFHYETGRTLDSGSYSVSCSLNSAFAEINPEINILPEKISGDFKKSEPDIYFKKCLVASVAYSQIFTSAGYKRGIDNLHVEVGYRVLSFLRAGFGYAFYWSNELLREKIIFTKTGYDYNFSGSWNMEISIFHGSELMETELLLI